MKTEHSKQVEKLLCPICESTLSNVPNLRVHYKRFHVRRKITNKQIKNIERVLVNKTQLTRGRFYHTDDESDSETQFESQSESDFSSSTSSCSDDSVFSYEESCDSSSTTSTSTISEERLNQSEPTAMEIEFVAVTDAAVSDESDCEDMFETHEQQQQPALNSQETIQLTGNSENSGIQIDDSAELMHMLVPEIIMTLPESPTNTIESDQSDCEEVFEPNEQQQQPETPHNSRDVAQTGENNDIDDEFLDEFIELLLSSSPNPTIAAVRSCDDFNEPHDRDEFKRPNWESITLSSIRELIWDPVTQIPIKEMQTNLSNTSDIVKIHPFDLATSEKRTLSASKLFALQTVRFPARKWFNTLKLKLKMRPMCESDMRYDEPLDMLSPKTEQIQSPMNESVFDLETGIPLQSSTPVRSCIFSFQIERIIHFKV